MLFLISFLLSLLYSIIIIVESIISPPKISEPRPCKSVIIKLHLNTPLPKTATVPSVIADSALANQVPYNMNSDQNAETKAEDDVDAGFTSLQSFGTSTAELFPDKEKSSIQNGQDDKNVIADCVEICLSLY